MAITVMLLGLALFLFFGMEDSAFVNRIVRDRIIAALQERVDPSLHLSIGDVHLKREESTTLVRVKDFTLRDKTGKALISAPSGKVSLETFAMLSFRLIPSDVTLEGLRVAVEVAENGSVVIAPEGDADVVAEPAPADKLTTPIEKLQQTINAAFAGFAATREAVGGKLPSLGIDDASLSVFDRRTGRRYSFSGINSRLHTADNGATRARTELKSGGAPFAVELEMSAPGANGQTFTARTDKLTLGDVLAIAGLKGQGIDARAPVSLTLRAAVDKDMAPGAAQAEFSLGKTSLKLDGPHQAPLTVDDVFARLSWDGKEAVLIDSLRVDAGGAKLDLKGTATPPTTSGEPWKIALGGEKLKLDGVTPTDRPVELAVVRAELSAWADNGRVMLDRMDITGPAVDVHMSGQLTFEADGKPAVALTLAAANTEARAALRLWPTFAAPEVRHWLVESLRGGLVDQVKLKLDFSGAVLETAIADKPVPDDALNVSWVVSRAVLRPVAGAPPIKDGVAIGLATGRMVRIDVSGGYIEPSAGRRISLSDGSFVVADTAREPADGRIRIKFSAGVDALAEFIRSPGIQPFAPASIDPAQVKGLADGEVTIALRLAKKPQNGDVRVALNANLKNVTIEKALGEDKIENGNFAMSVERDMVLLKGDGKVFGAPASIEVKGSAKAKPRATITTVLDDAARTRKGMNLGPLLTGPIGVKLSADLDESVERDVTLELDFVKAKVDGLIPGWTKAAGQPGKAKTVMGATDNGGWQLDDLEFDSGAVSLRGSATLGADGQFQKARLSSFKLSPGDNVHLDAEKTGGILKIDIKGNAFDTRPFLRSLQTATIDKSAGKDTEVTLKTTVLSGFNGEIVTNADLKLAQRGSEMKRFDLTGGFDNGNISARLVSRPGSQPTLIVDSEDAGAFLRFFDIYNRMRGGHLNLAATLGAGGQSGTILVRDFVLRNEPAMKRLVADPALTGGDTSRMDPAFVQRLNTNQDVPFTKMTVEFARSASRLDLKDAVIWGQDLGGSISGYMDYLRDRVDLTGIFVPAYTLNNFFAKVPVLGPLLGGGKNEGLFAVRYNITGKVSAPTLTFNPLTAIAPGFLRKIIDFKGAGGPGVPRQPGAER